MSSDKQKTENEVSGSEAHLAQQRGVTAAAISDFDTPNITLDKEIYGLEEYSGSKISGFPRPNEAYSHIIEDKKVAAECSQYSANISQDGENKRIDLVAAKDQTSDVDHCLNDSPVSGGRFARPHPLRDSISHGPTALSPPPRSYRDRARKELKGPVLFSEAEDTPSTVQSASDASSSQGEKPEFTKKHVRHGTFGQFSSSDFGRTTGDGMSPASVESDGENDCKSNSDSSY
ncbi:hypothetical protein HYPSUDRAFT_37551 [Hypholoma sublateritium FD-334 SS-4]|uniref:Uncharacterized protein n=1 Tax=Hypholoma sublateritium (strain FD-334 SS-4) TaxID=945553 RepID=A0A0D2P3V5_HYPSF|nr:hypothetical protein HYPSUDRAFT_37551 [Hypholoma sublateritium FD-334 SS-4]